MDSHLAPSASRAAQQWEHTVSGSVWATKGVAYWTAACPGCGVDAEWKASWQSNAKFKRIVYDIRCPTDGCVDTDTVIRPAAKAAA